MNRGTMYMYNAFVDAHIGVYSDPYCDRPACEAEEFFTLFKFPK